MTPAIGMQEYLQHVNYLIISFQKGKLHNMELSNFYPFTEY